MKNRFLQYMFLCGSLMVLFSACRKDSFPGKETLMSGKTFVYIDAGNGGGNGQQYDVHFLPFTETRAVPFFILRRDAANTADLQKAITVTMTNLDLDAYNAANGTEYSPITADVAVQATDPNITTTSTGVTFKMGAGVFAMNYVANVNGTNFDPSKKYAMYLAISSFGGFTKMHNHDGVSLDTVLVTLGVQNIYAGDYSSTGGLAFPGDVGNRTFTDLSKTLETVDASTSMVDVADLKGNGFYMNLKVNPDNTVTVTPAPISANQTIQNNGDCTYDPSSHVFTLNYKYVGGSGDRRINEVITLK